MSGPTIRERIEALRPWPEGEPLIRALLAYEKTVTRSASPTPNLDAMREAEDAARAAAPPVEPDCGAPSQGGPCVLPRGHNIGRADIPENHIGHSVPSPDRVTGLREAAQVVVNEWTLTIAEGGLVTIALQEPIDMLRAALLAEPVPGLDVERLARAIDDHGDNCSHMAIPECAGRIAAEYARLSETPDA